MDAREILSYISTHAANVAWDYGVVRDDESVLAFGTKNSDGSKIRVGSISHQDVDGEGYFLVLQYPNSEEEYRAKTLCELGWFLWFLNLNNGDFAKTSDEVQVH